MYFFYIDETGTRDPQVAGFNKKGKAITKDHLYVLTAVSLFEHKWRSFEQSLTNLKLELKDNLYRRRKMDLDLASCEVKSVWMRLPNLREKESPFLHALTDEERTRLAEQYFAQLVPQHMHVFSVVVDKRKLHGHVDHDILHKKAYEILLERIQHYLAEFHPKHQGIIVIDDTDKTINRSLAMKHAYFQREGNQSLQFKNIVEYPFFTDSKLSNGIQLADLCGYNIYRAFRNQDFRYPYFTRLLPHVYSSRQTHADKLDGLKVWPEDSDLVEWSRQNWLSYKTEQPTLWGGPPKK